MNERLQHLQRQHVLLREHIAWIEAEIAKETVPTEMSTQRQNTWAPTPPPTLNSTTTAAEPNNTTEPIDADALIERYAGKERQSPADVRRGCLMIFGGTMALIALVLFGVWWLRYR